MGEPSLELSFLCLLDRSSLRAAPTPVHPAPLSPSPRSSLLHPPSTFPIPSPLLVILALNKPASSPLPFTCFTPLTCSFFTPGSRSDSLLHNFGRRSTEGTNSLLLSTLRLSHPEGRPQESLAQPRQPQKAACVLLPEFFSSLFKRI